MQTFHPADLDAITKMLEELRLIGGEPFSPEHLIRSASTVLPFGLCNAAETVGHLVAQRMIPPPTNDEFMGVIEHVMESFHDLLAEEPESPYGSNSSRGAITPLVNAS